MSMYPAVLILLCSVVSAKKTCSADGPQGSFPSAEATSLLQQGRPMKNHPNTRNTNVVEESMASGRTNSSEGEKERIGAKPWGLTDNAYSDPCGFGWGNTCNDGSGDVWANCQRTWFGGGQRPGCNNGLVCTTDGQETLVGYKGSFCHKPWQSVAKGQKCYYHRECGYQKGFNYYGHLGYRMCGRLGKRFGLRYR